MKTKKKIKSGWYSHPESGETVWYDSKTNTFRDKVGGPARAALSIGYRYTAGKYTEPLTNLIGMTIKGAKKVVPPIYKATKKTIGDAVTSTGRALDRLLVTKTDPGFTDVKDKTGITEGLEAVKKDVKDLKPSPEEKDKKVITGKESNKKKIMITREQIHRALRNSGE